MIDLGAGAWVLLGVAAVVIGLSKTAVPASGTIAVAIFAAVLPARQSTGTILLLLILADMIALIAYRRDVNWRA
ncbi:MAG: sulfite exporter TauE/SafE family protein, partial [Microbacterium chocolatum]|nr:sulfite exporter TauE/SafE family protein [Microbacterium chocolatum]